jgi:alpha-glucosidase
VEAPIDRIPIFAKAGAVIPTQQVLQYSDQAPINPLTITLFLADSARYEYYEDDGLSFEYEKGVFAERSITFSKREGKVQVVMGDVQGGYRYPDRMVVVQIVGVDTAPSEVYVSGQPVPMTADFAPASEQTGWTYEAGYHSLRVKMPDLRTKQTITFH